MIGSRVPDLSIRILMLYGHGFDFKQLYERVITSRWRFCGISRCGPGVWLARVKGSTLDTK